MWGCPMADPIQLTIPSPSAAKISPCGRYRYTLHRRWGDAGGRRMVWVGLNPSTADALTDDPTIRRMRSFAERESCAEMVVINLYAWRATKPRELWPRPYAERLGPRNIEILQVQARRARETMHLIGPDIVIFAWGAIAGAPAARRREVREHIEMVDGIFSGCSVWCLGTTRSGMPRHPLYLPKNAPSFKWGLDMLNASNGRTSNRR